MGIVIVILHIICIILMEPFYVLMGFVLALAMPIITVIYGIVGMVKDNKMLMAIIGTNCGFAPLIFFLIGAIILST